MALRLGFQVCSIGILFYSSQSVVTSSHLPHAFVDDTSSRTLDVESHGTERLENRFLEEHDAKHHHYVGSHSHGPSHPIKKTVDRTGTARIFGGEYAPTDLFTDYTVGIYREQNGRLSPICGGVLLSGDMALTAAHCCGENANVVFSGIHDLRWTSSNNAGLNTRKYIVEELIPHPDYNTETLFNNDLCLLRLSIDASYVNRNYRLADEPKGSVFEPLIQLNDVEAKPSLPRNGISGDVLSVAGWGKTDTASYSLRMRYTTVSPITNDQCNNLYTSNRATPYVTSNMLCCVAPPDDPGNDACQGDSGGPLVLRGGADNGVDDLLVGIVSWGGDDCADPEYPGVYARVSENSDWIESTVCAVSEYAVCSDGNDKLRRRVLEAPTRGPTTVPTSTNVPTATPTTGMPTVSPTHGPTSPPTNTPTYIPTVQPTTLPSGIPSNRPTNVPSRIPSSKPSSTPSTAPTVHSSNGPSVSPTFDPSSTPSLRPSTTPSSIPTIHSSNGPSISPSLDPSSIPSLTPSQSVAPSVYVLPTGIPTSPPSGIPTVTILSFSPSFEGSASNDTTNSTKLLAQSGSYPRQAHPLSVHRWLLTTVMMALFMAELI